MSAAKLEGLAATFSMLDRVPDAAREQLGVEMARIGYDVLAAQKRDVAKATGDLEGGLTLKLMIEDLQVRVGLIGIKRGRSSLFYGRIVEGGRRAQTVLVTRRLKRKVRGNGRNGRQRTVKYEGKPYSMKVRAMAARPFVRVDRPEIRAEQRLANFWSEVLSKAGTA